jgi:lysophosphatidic acid phosphatase type 6
MNREKLTLVGAQIFFRHGARTPFNMLPNLEEVTYDKDLHLSHYKPADCEIKLVLKNQENTISERAYIGEHNVRKLNGGAAYSGQITVVGEKQLYDLGKDIHQDLIIKEKLLPEVYDPHLVYARSTYIDRTIQSARCFLAGLFTDKSGKIQANDPFEIEIHSWINEILYPNPRLYPALEKRLTPLELHELLHDEHDLKKARKQVLGKINLPDYEHGFLELLDDIKSREGKLYSDKLFV